MKKRKSNREIIESESPEVEHSYTKFTREELIPNTKNSTLTGAKSNLEKINETISRGGGNYLHLHTHPGKFYGSAIPSSVDLSGFNNQFSQRTMAIAVRNDIGKVIGSTMVFKYNKDSESSNRDYFSGTEENDLAINIYKETLDNSKETSEILSTLEDTLKFAGWGIRFHPARGYRFDKKTLRYEKKENNLEKNVSLILIGFGFIFLLTKISLSGFVIDNSVSNNPVVGLFSLVGFFFSLIMFVVLKAIKLKKKK
ncbi:MAG: hypothetical protein AABX99_00890 [Nanoarchaeota archaeon]